MNFGYLIYVASNPTVDYLKLAYALALSIKNTQSPGYGHVCLMTDDIDAVKKLKSPWVFDHVILHEGQPGWDSRSWMDRHSPFDYTICLDADMLFLRDYSHWVDYLIDNCDLYIPNNAYTYRGEIVTSDEYRKTFTRNELPNLYSFFTFFKKDKYTEFFDLARSIMENPNEYKNLYLSEYKPKVVGTDESFALSAKLLDIVNDISYPLNFPKVVHLKPLIQNWPWPADLVTDHAGFYFNSAGQLKIGNYQQTDVIHYVEKNIITDEIISMLEEIAWNKS